MVDYPPNKNDFMGIEWTKDTEHTLKDGIPAYGAGHFSIGVAYAYWSLCFVGVHGIARWYFGDHFFSIIYCVTLGLCFLGTIIDGCCMIPFVNESNEEIDKKVKEKRMERLRLQEIAVIPGQPAWAVTNNPPPPGYSGPGYSNLSSQLEYPQPGCTDPPGFQSVSPPSYN